MNPRCSADRDRMQLLLGERDELLRQLQHQLTDCRGRWERDATEWQRLQRHQRELAEWLVDRATNDDGRLVRSIVDAGLHGEAFVPCSFHFSANGKRYRLELASTNYEICEVTAIG